MERLTKYDEFGNAEFVGIDNTKLYERLVCDETVALTLATNKLGELEDVLEKYGIENPDILDLNLQTIKNINIQNANLRNELAELKQKAIVPKFQVGQEVYIICEPNRVVSGWKITDYEYYKQQYIVETKSSIDWIYKDRIFATKEEAEQKLAEIGGKNE